MKKAFRLPAQNVVNVVLALTAIALGDDDRPGPGQA
jgi:hypothetical protein